MAIPQTIRVAAVPGIFAPVPGHDATHGRQSAYVGRRIDHDAVKANSSVRVDDGQVVLSNNDACYPADAEHNAVFGHRSHGIGVLQSLRKLIRDGDIAAADALTAAWAGVPKPAEAAPPAPQATTRAARRTSTADAEDTTK